MEPYVSECLRVGFCSLILHAASSANTIDEWERATTSRKNYLINEGSKRANPYEEYVSENFRNISGFLSEDPITKDEELFFLGRAIYTLDLRHAHGNDNRQSLEKLIADERYNEVWQQMTDNEIPGDIQTVIGWTEDRLFECLTPHITPWASEAASHLNRRGRKPPTQADEAHIVQNWERLGLNHDNWFFHSTLHSADQGSHARRIVHLFARVDDDGNLQNVLTIRLPGQTCTDSIL